eukprot:1140761-Pelagomonas_calceolata.AAC.2
MDGRMQSALLQKQSTLAPIPGIRVDIDAAGSTKEATPSRQRASGHWQSCVLTDAAAFQSCLHSPVGGSLQTCDGCLAHAAARVGFWGGWVGSIACVALRGCRPHGSAAGAAGDAADVAAAALGGAAAAAAAVVAPGAAALAGSPAAGAGGGQAGAPRGAAGRLATYRAEAAAAPAVVADGAVDGAAPGEAVGLLGPAPGPAADYLCRRPALDMPHGQMVAAWRDGQHSARTWGQLASPGGWGGLTVMVTHQSLRDRELSPGWGTHGCHHLWLHQQAGPSVGKEP